MTRKADAVVPSVALGFARRLDGNRVSVLYSYAHGIGEFVLPSSGVPEVLLPETDGPREADAAALESNRPRAVEGFLLDNNVVRVVSIRVAECEPSTRFWIGSSDAERLTPDRLHRLEAVAQAGAALLNRPVSPGEEAEQLRRLELAAGLLPALLHVLDVREVFDRLSTAAKRALPHDMLILILFNDDLSKFTIFAHSDRGSNLGSVLPNSYPAAAIRAWEFAIVDDHTLHPLERDTPATRMGARSSLRFPIRFDDRVIGGVGFVSFDPGKYSGADVAVGRRLADHVASALSHYNLATQLAEESRAAAAVQERAASLDLLDGLMGAITEVLDVREVFDRIFEVSQRALAHDGMSIAVPTPDGSRVTLYATTGALRHLQTPWEMPLLDTSLIQRDWDFILIDDCLANPRYEGIPSVKAGMRSLVIIPVRLEQRLRAWVNFWSVTPGRFTADDVPVARRIAAHITLTLSHQRLAEQAQHHEELRARTTNLELLDALLATMTEGANLRDVIDPVSEIARKVVPHDAMVVPVLLPPEGARARFYATTKAVGKFPEVIDVPEPLRHADWEYELVDDLELHPVQQNMMAAKLGYRSILWIPIRVESRTVASVGFLSLQASAFTPQDILPGRRIADRLALSLLRERGLDAARRADEASERVSRLEARVRALTEELDSRTGYRRVIGESPLWRQALTQATQVAATDTTVLLLGESGTGKEVIARFLHRGSQRNRGPFVALNCAALPEQLLEAELFGYERGAYTGATQTKPGQLEQAAGGTLFLDEVAEMSPSAQAKILRVLQEREFQRLGGTRVLRTDARVVAATNRDLQRAIANGQFREDLYYRLNVFAIRLPPLRERRDDVLPLSEAFLADIGRGLGTPPAGISRDARQLLVGYHWPGNVRELRNILERAAILCDGGLITAEHLALIPASPAIASPPPVRPAPAAEATSVAAAAGPAPPAASGDLQTVERAMIEQALQNARFNKSQAAKALGLSRHQLYVRMRKHGFV